LFTVGFLTHLIFYKQPKNKLPCLTCSRCKAIVPTGFVYRITCFRTDDTITELIVPMCDKMKKLCE